MQTTYIQIGTHILFVSTADELTMEWVRGQFNECPIEQQQAALPDMYIRISRGYGTELRNIRVDIAKERDRMIYRRDDYWLDTDEHYKRIILKIHNELSLNHAIMTIYSAFIVYNRWGLMLHSSCVVESDKAYLFAGQSGAGKSTVVKLSQPRPILSDEATLIHITGEGALVYDSPFRSDTIANEDHKPVTLAGVYLLEQSGKIEARQIKPSDSLIRLMDKIFYWAVEPAETVKLLSLCGKLVDLVPTYELKFQKNDQFWEMIS